MSKTHPGLPIPDDWNGQDWCHFAICWPDSLQWRAILAGFISTPSLGRAWDGATGTIVDAQAIGSEIWLRNIEWRYCLMSSCSESSAELIAAIRYLADHIGPATGDTGTGGATVSPPYGPGYTGETYPEGFASKAAWDTYRCDYLGDKLGRVVDDLTALTTVQFAGLVVVSLIPVLATIFLSPIPPAGLFVLAGLLIGVAAYGNSALAIIKDSFGTAFDEILCRMWRAASPELSAEAGAVAFDEEVARETTDPIVRYYAGQIVRQFLNSNLTNPAWEYHPEVVYDSSTCDLCAEPTGAFYPVPDGHAITVADIGGGSYTITFDIDEPELAFYLAGFAITDPAGRFTITDITVDSGTWLPETGSSTYGYIVNDSGVYVNCQFTTANFFTANIQRAVLYCANDGATVTITVSVT